MIEEIIDSLEWSAAHNGVKYAEPTPDFWAAWRSDKESVKALGIRVRPANGGGWEVSRRVKVAVPAEVVTEVAAEVYPPIESRQASRIEDFEPAELDSSRRWSDEQHAIFAAFRKGEGNYVVQARAGTGKTTTIKAAFSQAPEEKMLYAVFNKKNQREAAAAIEDLRVDVLTLHALGYRFIRSFWANARPDDEVEKYRVACACGNDAPDEARATVYKLVGFLKNSTVAPSLEDAIDIADARGCDLPDFEALGWTIARLSQCALKVLELSRVRDQQGRISFNDMVWLPVAMGWVRPEYDLVCIDEAQDMSLPQLVMAMKSCKTGGRIFVVGDDRQAIYAFRGAAQDGMAMMQAKLNARVFPLTVTRRCPKAVVSIVTSELVPDYRAADDAPEGVVRHIPKSLLSSQVQTGDSILSRANAPLMGICLSLIRKGVSARIEGRDIGKTLAEIVRRLNAKSVPQFITKVETWAERMKDRFKGSKHFEAKAALVDDQAATLLAVAEGAANVREIPERLQALFQDTDGNSKPAVILSTVHKAKGLEWNRVFVLADTFKKRGGEEDNVYYVAITRAKQELVLVGDDSAKQENN